MDPIHPIRLGSTYPAAVQRVRRVTRAGEERPDDEPGEPRRKSGAPAPADPATAVVDGDGHVDARA